MFTGLVQKIGILKSFRPHEGQALFRISSGFENLEEGESIAIMGTCLSVVEKNKGDFTVFASKETMDITGLGNLKKGAKLNLERALTFSSLLGGHLVTGHVDARVKLFSKKSLRSAYCYSFAMPDSSELKNQIAPKGSITVDGVSLTVNQVFKDRFELTVIPITIENTTLGFTNPGDEVNIETDILAKYISRLLSEKTNDISLDTLKNNGFI